MGKGTIISGGTDGQYQIQLNYDPDRKALAIQRLEDKITAIDLKIAAETDEVKLGVYKLIKVSYQKKIDAINEYCTEDPTVSAWCADLTEDLTGVVGTIEVPGELGTVNIYPGFDGGAVYATTQGQLGDNYLLPPAGSFYNLAMLPGWQKWKPTFRYATITALDGDIASIEYEVTESSQQGLNINQTDSQDDVEIDYMDCNGAAFEEGDEVLVKFENQDWTSPKIIGFKDNPKPCGFMLKCTFNGHIPITGGERIGLKYIFSDSTESVLFGICQPGGVVNGIFNNISDPVTGERVDPEIHLYSHFNYFRTPNNDEIPDTYVRFYTETISASILPYPWHDGGINGRIAFQRVYSINEPANDGYGEWIGICTVESIKYEQSLSECSYHEENIDGTNKKVYEIDFTGIKGNIRTTDTYGFACWDESLKNSIVSTTPLPDYVYFPTGGSYWIETTTGGYNNLPEDFGYTTYLGRRYFYAETPDFPASDMLIMSDEFGNILNEPIAQINCFVSITYSEYIECVTELCASADEIIVCWENELLEKQYQTVTESAQILSASYF